MCSSQIPCRTQRAASGWISKPSYCPLHSGFAAQKQHSSHLQPSWHTTTHHLRWVPSTRVSKKSGLCSEATTFLIKHLHPPSLSGLQQLSRIAVLHQRSGLCWVSSEHGHRFFPSRRFFGWADDAWGGRGTQQPAICPIWDLPS